MTLLDLDVRPYLDDARACSDAGQHGAAATRLYELLAQFSPITTSPEPRLTQAAIRYVDAALTDRTEHEAVTQWARYAYEAGCRLPDGADETTLRVGGHYARLLLQGGSPHDAARIARQITAGTARLHGAAATPSIAAQELLAVCLHRCGRCAQARTVISDAWRQWVPDRRHHDQRSVSLLASLAGIAAQCGPHPAADDWLHHLLIECPPPVGADPAGTSWTAHVEQGDVSRHQTVCEYTRRADPSRARKRRR